MTLSTMIYIIDPIDAEEVFLEVRSILGANSDVPIIRENNTISHPWGIGLPAALEVTYHDSPYQEPEHRIECYREGYESAPEHYVNVYLDTTYGYSGLGGENCNKLHAKIIASIVLFCMERNARVIWYNEYTSEYYYGISGLKQFVKDDHWFASNMLPILCNMKGVL